MPKFFGFQGTGVLLYDKETNWFFTDLRQQVLDVVETPAARLEESD